MFGGRTSRTMSSVQEPEVSHESNRKWGGVFPSAGTGDQVGPSITNMVGLQADAEAEETTQPTDGGEAEIKWPIFCKRHFQMHFPKENWETLIPFQ